MKCHNCLFECDAEHRFCQNCGSELRYPIECKLSDGMRFGASPVELSVNVGDSLQSGRPAVLSCRLSGASDAIAQRIELEIASSGLGINKILRCVVAPGSIIGAEIEFCPPTSGSFSLSFFVTLENKDRYNGSRVVAVAPAESRQPIINFTDSRVFDAKFVVGQETNIAFNVAQPSDESSSGIRESEYKPVDLVIVPPQHRPVLASVRRPAGCIDAENRYRSDRISLEVRVNDSIRNICLLAGTSFRIGKQRGNDVVLRTYPESEENEARSAKISRLHAEICFTDQGAVWKNLDCVNGTFIGSELLQAGGRVPLRTGIVLRPGDALELLCHAFPADQGSFDSPAYERFQLDLGGPVTAPPIGHQSALRLSRTDGLRFREEYLFVQQAALIGNAGCPISGDDSPAGTVHAQLIWLAGSFWLESLRPECAVLVNRRQVLAGQLYALSPGTAVQFGNVEVVVRAYGQYVIDVPL